MLADLFLEVLALWGWTEQESTTPPLDFHVRTVARSQAVRGHYVEFVG